MAVIPDGRVDYDKLLELLLETEENHLDFKSGVDLDDNADRLKLVKDIVTMSNRPPGGYILIGVTNDGKPCMSQGTIADRREFDGAKLGDLVRRNIEGQVNVRTVVHDHDEYEIVLIFVEHSGLPVPFSKLGQHPDPSLPDKQIVIFRPGDIFVREGAQNVPIRNAHWPDLLSAYTKRIRDEAGDLAETVMREFISQFRQHPTGAPAEIPLLWDMDEATFTDAVVAMIEAKNDVRLRQFLRTLRKYVNASSTLEDCEMALDRWAIFCAQATIFERDDLTGNAIAALFDAYRELGAGPDLTRKRLAVVIRIYAIGSLAVRMAAWETVHSLVLRPVPSTPFDNSWVYSSWIRHAQVEASRAGLIKDDRGGFLISAARELMMNQPGMRPDIGDDEIPPRDEVTANDVLLNTLCEFDIAYCLVVAAEGTGKGAFYASSAAFDEDRAKPMALKIVEDSKVRRLLFPASDDDRVGDALALVYHRTIRESANNLGGRWWTAPQAVIEFINDNGGPRTFDDS
ncbi:ATP-binding protein [Mycolicibacterium pulveris]|uniref:Schlafen AlbA-2 domain-containing protein n=1 Tax=Mycolicibacterium pulveris TaxID=36813 RepID=A0A7I7UMK5_MYCPV|nr:ATP-binding protein [Mycolicibacterium pulveris]MCV6981439.1 ATP-binding protein [Mycolicibacterium pulveris]BBY82103.1 hypothetical protein MPUL_32610 [Mycolicibacterium pulveris]